MDFKTILIKYSKSFLSFHKNTPRQLKQISIDGSGPSASAFRLFVTLKGLILSRACVSSPNFLAENRKPRL